MNPTDSNYIHKQFKEKLHEGKATEFQTLAEGILSIRYPGFQKIKPSGNKGDGGNDGYIPNTGRYFQMYAPEKPSEREFMAIKKFKDDFNNKLKKKWDSIEKIKEYNFVYNDKPNGITINLESARSELAYNNPGIKFNIIDSDRLWEIVKKFSPRDLIILGLDVAKTSQVATLIKMLHAVYNYIDNEDLVNATINLNLIEPFTVDTPHDEISYTYKLLKARICHKQENIPEAISKFTQLIDLYPDKIEPFLYLAAIHLDNGDFGKNKDFLNKATEIDPSHWLLILEQHRRSVVLKNKLTSYEFDEDYPPKIKAQFERVFAAAKLQENDFTAARTFILKAIGHNEHSSINYIVKIEIQWHALTKNNLSLSFVDFKDRIGKFLQDIKVDTSLLLPRRSVILNFIKYYAYHMSEAYQESGKCLEFCFNDILKCYFNPQIDNVISGLLTIQPLNLSRLEQLCDYLLKMQANISVNLAKLLLTSFVYNNNLISSKVFFEKVNSPYILQIIDLISNKSYRDLTKLIATDLEFGINLAQTAIYFPELRLYLISNLPIEKTQQTHLLFLYYHDSGDINQAFHYLQSLDISKYPVTECDKFLKIAQDVHAHEYQVRILKILESYNVLPASKLTLDLMLAYFHLKNFKEIIEIGKKYLEKSPSEENFEQILGGVLISHLERAENAEALSLLVKYKGMPFSWEFILFCVKIYEKNNLKSEGIALLIDSIKLRSQKIPITDQFYAALYFEYIGVINNVKFQSLQQASDNSFVKISGQNKWLFLGEGQELDAIKLCVNSHKYISLVNKKIGDNVILNKYNPSQDQIIERIFDIDQYILWQIHHYSRELSDTLSNVIPIPLPITDGKLDLKHLLTFLDDYTNKNKELLSLYLNGQCSIPILASSEPNGLLGAIYKIIHKNGFINCTSGNEDELALQIETGRKIVEGAQFYLDTTSIFFLSESNMLSKIINHIPCYRLTQASLSFMNKLLQKLSTSSESINYIDGHIQLNKYDAHNNEAAINFHKNTLELLELAPEKVVVMSQTTRDMLSLGIHVSPELGDACLIAQNENLPILIEDYLHYHLNAIGKQAPVIKYCSTIFLVKALYEVGKLSFEDYLDFFFYLTTYRFKFLPINVIDIEKAVLGDKIIRRIQPSNIKKFNFKLTLSEEYGVKFETAFRVVQQFLFRILQDNYLLAEEVDRIFLILLDEFPTGSISKQELRKQLLLGCQNIAINHFQFNVITTSIPTLIRNRVHRLSKLII